MTSAMLCTISTYYTISRLHFIQGYRKNTIKINQFKLSTKLLYLLSHDIMFNI